MTDRSDEMSDEVKKFVLRFIDAVEGLDTSDRVKKPKALATWVQHMIQQAIDYENERRTAVRPERKDTITQLTEALYRLQRGEGYTPARAADVATMIVDLVFDRKLQWIDTAAKPCPECDAAAGHSEASYLLFRGKTRIARYDDPHALAAWLEDAVAEQKPITPFDVVALCDGVELWTMQADQWLAVWQDGGRGPKLHPLSVKIQPGTWRGIAVEQANSELPIYYTITRSITGLDGQPGRLIVWDHCSLPEAVEYLEAIKDDPRSEYHVQAKRKDTGEAAGYDHRADHFLGLHGRRYWRLVLPGRIEYHVTYGDDRPTPACVEMSPDEYESIMADPRALKPMVWPGKTLHAVIELNAPSDDDKRAIASAHVAVSVLLEGMEKDAVEDALQSLVLFIKHSSADEKTIVAHGLLAAFWDRMAIGASDDVFSPESFDLLKSIEKQIKGSN